MSSKIDLGRSCLSLLPAGENVNYDVGSCDSDEENKGGEEEKNRFEIFGGRLLERTMGRYVKYTFLFLFSLDFRDQTLVNFGRVFEDI